MLIEVGSIHEDVVTVIALRKRVILVLEVIGQHVAEDALVRTKLQPTVATDQLAKLRRDFRGHDGARRRLRTAFIGG